MSEDLKQTNRLTMIPYKNRLKSYILVTEIEEPYGAGSDPVVSIGCTLKDEIYNPTWKVHVPRDLIPDLITVLQEVGK